MLDSVFSADFQLEELLPVTGAQIDMRFSGHVTAMPAGVASIPTAPS